MSGNEINKLNLTKLKSKIELARDVVAFKPNRDQRRAKSNFWSHFVEKDSMPPDTVELAAALRYGADRRISDWWDLDSFQDWFTNKDEFRQRVEFLADLALDHVESILYDEKAKAGEKIAAIKLIMEVGSKMSKKSNKEEYLDEKIAAMDKKQLEDYIKKNVRYITDTQKELTDPLASDTIDLS